MSSNVMMNMTLQEVKLKNYFNSVESSSCASCEHLKIYCVSEDSRVTRLLLPIKATCLVVQKIPLSALYACIGDTRFRAHNPKCVLVTGAVSRRLFGQHAIAKFRKLYYKKRQSIVKISTQGKQCFVCGPKHLSVQNLCVLKLMIMVNMRCE